MAASEKSGRPLFCGSYPITPATAILEELAKRKDLNVKTLQAEDEISGICTAIGAAFAGNFAVTTTSGPGLSLKSEALGTGRDDRAAVGGRRRAARRSFDGFADQTRAGRPESQAFGAATASARWWSWLRARLRLFSLCFLGRQDRHGAHDARAAAFRRLYRQRLGAVADSVDERIPENHASDRYPGSGGRFQPYARDEKRLARIGRCPGPRGSSTGWAAWKRIRVSGAVSHDPENHERMVGLRAAKVAQACGRHPRKRSWGATRRRPAGRRDGAARTAIC